MGSKTIICADTTKWIEETEEMDSVVTSLPDREETTMDLDEWRNWFVEIVGKIVNKTKNYAIFYQTDRKADGELLDKSFMLNLGNEAVGGRTMWHKIALRNDAGKIDLFRPTYTHILCFTRNKDLGPGKATPDVINRGKMIYDNAMGLKACKFAIEFIQKNCDSKTIFDPFCGQGSVLAVANKLGFDAVGVEILPEQVEKSKRLVFI